MEFLRNAAVTRKTKETDVKVVINLDGTGGSEISTGIGFFDHMLTAFAKHSGFDLNISTVGDLEVDGHHTVEDTGIVLGQAFAKALEDCGPICRYGSFYAPMDESLALAVADICQRPNLVFNCELTPCCVGELDTQLIKEFWAAFAFNAKITLHINLLYGENDHHKIEAIFKAAAQALKIAVKPSDTLISTKGVL